MVWVMLLNRLLRKEAFKAGHWWPTPLIPAILEAEAVRSELCEFEVTVQVTVQVTVRAWSAERVPGRPGLY